MARAHGEALPATTDPTVFTEIAVTITDSRITVTPDHVERGEYARFVVHNLGRKPHTFTLGSTKGRGSGVQTGFSRMVKPQSEKILLLYLDYRGKLPYHSALKEDLKKPGMKGIFIAAGYSGHGVAMAFLCGSLVADMAAGRSPEIPSAFSPARFV